jgi:neurotransmitter:Na+ symporter, NSS family
VWAAAFGQIFFSLSIGFGIMITYASYVGRKTDMTGSGLVVGFANSGFELLAGIGVFAALGFMAQASGVAVDEVATSGIGLAFIAFPDDHQRGARPARSSASCSSGRSSSPADLAGERDRGRHLRGARQVRPQPGHRHDGGRRARRVLSLLFFSTTSGIYVLDIVDHFVNRFGILVVAVVSMLVVAWVVRALPRAGGSAASPPCTADERVAGGRCGQLVGALHEEVRARSRPDFRFGACAQGYPSSPAVRTRGDRR